MTTRNRGLALLSTGIAACLTVLLATSCTSTEGPSPRRPPTERQATASPSPTFVTFRWPRYPTCQEFASSFATQTYGTWYVDQGKDPTPSPEPLSAGEWDCLVRGRSKDARTTAMTSVHLYRPPSINPSDHPLDFHLRSDADSYMGMPCMGAAEKSLPGDYVYSRECIWTSATPTMAVAVVLVGPRGVAGAEMVVWNQDLSTDEARNYAETTAVDVAKLAFSRL